jgi:hypothetical protein
MTNKISEISLRIRVEFGFFLAISAHLNFIYVDESSHMLKSKRQFRKYINNLQNKSVGD